MATATLLPNEQFALRKWIRWLRGDIATDTAWNAAKVKKHPNAKLRDTSDDRALLELATKAGRAFDAGLAAEAVAGFHEFETALDAVIEKRQAERAIGRESR